MKHIALVVPTIDRLAGAERQVLLLANGLHNRGWRVTVIALSGTGGSAACQLLDSHIGFLTLGMRKGLADPRGWLRLIRWLRHQRPDVVHSHLPHAAWMTRWSRLLAPSRVVIDTIHTSAIGTLGRRLGYRCSRWLPDLVTAVSQSVADANTSASMVSSARLTVLPNVVDVYQFQPDPSARASLRRHHGLTSEFLWLAVGRLEPVKDYPCMLRAMAQVPLPSRLVIAGAGPLEQHLRGLANKLGLESRVRFLGFEPNILPWLHAADGFLLSSLYEGLPVCLLEAGACAVPAVATDVPGTRDVLIQGRTGLLTAPGDPSALAAAMTRIMRLSPAQLGSMGRHARERIALSFSLEAALDRWGLLYSRLLDERPRRSRAAIHRSSTCPAPAAADPLPVHPKSE